MSSNTSVIYEAQFMKKLSNAEAELEKRVAYSNKIIPCFWDDS